eukprot:Skav202577  [mRNA]  locus=scaffold104:201222:206916:+ [translate_table: standard]
MLDPGHPLGKDRRDRDPRQLQLCTAVGDVALEELLKVWQHMWMPNAVVGLEESLQSHGIDHGRVDAIRNAKL